MNIALGTLDEERRPIDAEFVVWPRNHLPIFDQFAKMRHVESEARKGTLRRIDLRDGRASFDGSGKESPDMELTERLSHLASDLTTVKTDVAFLKTDLAVVKTDVAVLKTGVAVLKTDVAVLKTDVSGLKTDVSAVRTDVSALKTDMAVVKSNYATKADVLEAKNSVIVWVVSAVFIAQLLPGFLKKFGL
jgi:outer membrane murein-binding lipoprotein Lpp